VAKTEAKRLELLHELRPHATTTAVLVNPGAIPRAEFQLNDIQAAARSAGQDIHILNASTIHDIDAAFAKLVQMRADALLVTTDSFFFTHAPQLVVLAARHAIPTVYFRREFATAGGLMSYAANSDESYTALPMVRSTGCRRSQLTWSTARSMYWWPWRIPLRSLPKRRQGPFQWSL
jgi:putative ABC transport system substrate-binding protein